MWHAEDWEKNFAESEAASALQDTLQYVHKVGKKLSEYNTVLKDNLIAREEARAPIVPTASVFLARPHELEATSSTRLRQIGDVIRGVQTVMVWR